MRPEETAAERYLREFGGAPVRATRSDAMTQAMAEADAEADRLWQTRRIT
jgi:hypothetical protein